MERMSLALTFSLTVFTHMTMYTSLCTVLYSALIDKTLLQHTDGSPQSFVVIYFGIKSSVRHMAANEKVY